MCVCVCAFSTALIDWRPYCERSFSFGQRWIHKSRRDSKSIGKFVPHRNPIWLDPRETPSAFGKNHCRKIANAIIIWYKRMSVNTTEIVVCNVGGDWRATIRAFVGGDWRATIRAFVWQAPICRRKSSEKRGVCYKPDGETYYNIMCNLLVVGYLCAIYRYCVYCRYTRFYR